MLPSPLLRVLAAPGPLLTAKSQLIPRKRCTSYTAPRISSLSINPRKSFQGELLYLEFRGEHKVNQKRDTVDVHYDLSSNTKSSSVSYYDNDLKLKAGVKWLCCCQAVTVGTDQLRLGLMAGDNGMAKHKLVKCTLQWTCTTCS